MSKSLKEAPGALGELKSTLCSFPSAQRTHFLADLPNEGWVIAVFFPDSFRSEGHRRLSLRAQAQANAPQMGYRVLSSHLPTLLPQPGHLIADEDLSNDGQAVDNIALPTPAI